MNGRKAVLFGLLMGVIIMLSMRTPCVTSGVEFPVEGD